MVSSSLPEACVIINPPSRHGNCTSSSPVDLCQFLQMLCPRLLTAFSRGYSMGFLLHKCMLLLSKSKLLIIAKIQLKLELLVWSSGSMFSS